MSNIVGASFGMGQRRKGVDFAFKDLYQRGVFSALNSNLFIEYVCNNAMENGNPLYIDDYFKNLKDWIVKAHSQSDLTITIGGDHSVAISSVYASKEVHDDLALIWIDAHGDYNTVETSVTKNLHGLPLNAIVNGQATFSVPEYDSDSFWLKSSVYPSFPSFNPFGWLNNGAISPDKIAIIGLRDVDDEEKILLEQSGINLFWMDDVKKNGIESTLKTALRTVAPTPATKLHVSLDVDAMSHEEFPATGCYCPDGLTVNEVKFMLTKCIESKSLVGFDLVEYNPLIHNEAQCWKICHELLQILHPNP